MKHIIFLLFIFSFYTISADNRYHFSVDLTKCQKDKLQIELIAPDITSSEIIYRLPKIVPGTYEILNFGRFVSEFKATDSAGIELKVEKTDLNGWKIFRAEDLHRITYEVEDSWDTEIKEPYIFEPAGSNFEVGKNFLLNTHCLFGYFENMTGIPYRIDVTHPAEFYGSCSLTDVVYKDNVDTYSVSDYMQLQDAPMMYAVPDTTVLNIGGAQILISLYSQNKVTTSKFIAENISEILIAQQE